MTRMQFSFTSPEITKVIEDIMTNGESVIHSDRITMRNGDWIEISLTERMPKPRPPSLDPDFEWRIRIWNSSGIVIAAAVWENSPEINPKFVIISDGIWVKCSESEMREFLMKRSDQLGEWLLWNLI